MVRRGLQEQKQRQKQQGGKELLAKTPKRGKGSMKKKPISRALPSSATRKTKRTPTSKVSEDTEEVAKREEEKPACSHAPIEERLSRLCLSPQSPPLLGPKKGDLAEEEDDEMDKLEKEYRHDDCCNHHHVEDFSGIYEEQRDIGYQDLFDFGYEDEIPEDVLFRLRRKKEKYEHFRFW